MPKNFYHGSEVIFEEFDPQRIGTKTVTRGLGFWFTSNRDAALFFGDKVATVRLNLANTRHVLREEFIEGIRSPLGLASEAYRDGYDSLTIHDITDGDRFSDEVTCVFDVDRITILGWEET